MAPPGGKRMKGVQIYRPFIYGTTARPFNDTDNPKPPGVPADHTHSWQVFVKGIEDTDIFYWLRRVQFKLHESIPNHLRTLDADTIIREIEKNNNTATTGNKKQQAAAAQQNKDQNPQQNQRAFVVNETGWGEFEITIKLYYDSRSGEKPQTLYHHLRLHPYGRTEAEKEAMRSGGEVVAWTYEEQLFNEPFEDFYHVLTTGAHDKGTKPPPLPPASGGGKGKGSGGKGGGNNKAAQHQRNASSSSAIAIDGSGSGGGGMLSGDVKERSAMIPPSNKPGQPFSRDTEQLEIKRLREAGDKVHQMVLEMNKSIKDKEAELTRLKAENAAPLPPAGAAVVTASSSTATATATTKKNAANSNNTATTVTTAATAPDKAPASAMTTTTTAAV